MEDRFATNNASFRSSTYPSRARKAFLTRRKSGPLNISIVDLACPSFGTLPVQKQQQQQQQDSSPGQSGSKRAPQGKLRRDTGKHNVMPTSLKSLKSMRTLDSSVLYQLREQAMKNMQGIMHIQDSQGKHKDSFVNAFGSQDSEGSEEQGFKASTRPISRV